MSSRNKGYIGGRSVATAATIRHVAATLWNPSGAARIFVYEIWVCDTAATAANLGISRTTTRGTPGSTVTPDLDNMVERDVAPPSGCLLDLATYTVQPTVDGSDLIRWNLAGAIGNGVMLVFPDPITIPPGTGLAVITPIAAVLPASDFTYVFGD